MKSDHQSQAHRLINCRAVVCSIWMALPVFLLFFTVAGDAAAASGSTRLTIHIDQGVVDAIARLKGEMVQPLAAPMVGEADLVLQRLLPVARAGMKMTHHPSSARQILQRLQQDALIVFGGQAEHAGSTGKTCVSDEAAGGVLTVHSI